MLHFPHEAYRGSKKASVAMQRIHHDVTTPAVSDSTVRLCAEVEGLIGYEGCCKGCLRQRGYDPIDKLKRILDPRPSHRDSSVR